VATQRQAADTYRRQQTALNAALVSDIMRMWRALFDPGDAEGSWRALRTAIASLVRNRSNESGRMAATYYQTARRLAGAPGGFTPSVAGPPDDDVLGATLDSTGFGSYLHGRKQGQHAETAKRNAGVHLAGASTRLAQQAGRETVRSSAQGDRYAIGWMRVTDADPCAWCAMLASRGAVYKSRASAGGRGGRFAGVNPDAWHNHCGCVATPVFSDKDPRLDAADELYDRWLDVTGGDFGKDKLRAWRRHWDAKEKGDGATVG